VHHFEQLIRENPPSAGQISVVAPAHLRKLPTAGNSVEQYKYRVNGSATRLPPLGLAALALEGGACEAGGPGPHGGFLLPDMIASVRHD